MITPRILAIAAFLLIATPAHAAFSDVPSNHPNAEAIAYVQAKGIVSGYGDGSFRPDQKINRAEFTKIIVASYVSDEEIYDCPLHGDTASLFSDLEERAWYLAPLCVAHLKGVIAGYPDGTFRPSANINFVEAAKIIVHSFDIATDAGHTAPSDIWFVPYVIDLNVYNAIPTSITRFDQSITRGEMAEMIWRLKAGITNKPTQTYESLAGEKSDGWKAFNSQYFTLSFNVPAGFEVTDNPDAIAVSKGPLQSYDIGGGSAFMTIVRFDERNTRDNAIALTRKLLKNQKESTITVDGSSFFMIEGDDYGRYEGDSAGRIMKIFFPKSVLEVQERPGNQTQSFDVMVTAKNIIATMKFASTTK